jgi:hypothetical protein
MKLYCNKCYAKTEYKFSKPKFCPECGEKISSSIGATSISPSLIKPQEFKKENITVSRSESVLDNENEDIEQEDQDLEEDYLRTQKYIESFKRNRKRSGVTVEKSNFGGGISFGELMEKASSEPNASKDFQGFNTIENRKTKEQILEELRSESSSKARVIDID